MFRFIILGLLRHGGTLHGYAVMKAYRGRTGIQMSTGAFYRELQNLAAQGLVLIVDRAPDDDARRTPYAITPRGSELFDRWLVRPPVIALGSDDELTARTMFLHEAPVEVACRLIDAWKEELWLLSKQFERDRQSEVGRCASDGPESSILALLLARRLRHLAGDVEYLDELRSDLEATRTRAAPTAARAQRRPTATKSSEKRARSRARSRAATASPARLP